MVRTHFAEGIFGARLDLERVPRLPKLGLRLGVAELARMSVDRTRTLVFAELALHRGKAHAQQRRLAVGKRLDARLVDGARGCQAVVRRGLGGVEKVHLVAVVDGHRLGRTLVDAHRLAHQAVLLLKLAVLQIEQLGKLGGTLFERLLKQVARTFEARATLRQ